MARKLPPALALALAGALSAFPAALSAQSITSAQQSTPPAQSGAATLTSAGTAARTLRAAPAAEIRVDGRLDEAAWATAPAATDFVQQRPSSGAPATERTEARVLFDAENLYVGMRMYDAHPDSILGQLTRRDLASTSDGARVFVDSYNDKRTAFVFGLNPRGVKDDFLRFGDGEGADFGWDAVWDGAARVDSLGWVAEFRIPLSQLRFNATTVNGGGRWGLNFRREIARKAETVFWSPIPANANAFVSLFGELEGLSSLRQGRRLEVLPYVSSKVDHVPPALRSPFVSANEFTGSFGADLKAGLPGGLTLSATLNPDFGQVEVDPAVVNLSAFETFYPEQRPFFVEGSDIFQFGRLTTFNLSGQPTFFYSRRIGRAPQGFVGVEEAYHTHAPDATTILGAAKVSGKAGPWSVGIMDALTQREVARWRSEDGLASGEYPVEPLTNYFVGRVKRDFNRGATVLGGLLTGVTRDMRGAEFDPFLRSSAYLAGIDGQHAWGNRAWTVSGYLAQAVVSGSEEAIALTQNSSARYFARPDAEHVELDEERTSLRGGIWGASLSHGGAWDASLTYLEVSPGFEPNDLGFMGRADQRTLSTFVGQRVNKVRGPFRSHSYYAYSNYGWNFDGDQIFHGYGLGANGQLKSLWGIGFEANYNPEFVNDRLTRGGPLALVPGQWSVAVYGNTDSRKRVSASLSLNYREDDSGEYDRAVDLGLSFRPTSSVQVSVGPFLARERDTDQFVARVDDPAAGATFGRRYLFANVDQTTFAMNTRVDWTFSPTLSLQVFAQPFVAVGNFWGYKTLDEARTFDFTTLPGSHDGTASFVADFNGDPADGVAQTTVGSWPNQLDFTLRSLRGNAVLRWEYRPGSALFFVWQQERFGDRVDGRFDFGDDVRGVFGERARNVFLIKATYWLNR
jgi:uncharacterized protein DUF5916/cellulose/xylan binding protein with CBM9 domain